MCSGNFLTNCCRHLLFASLVVTTATVADEDLVSDDGREVHIKSDGTWSFRSDDRFANTQDGRRIRLKSDGTWQYEGNAPLQTEEQFRSQITDVKLQKVEFEAIRSKAHKNTRKQTQTVFYLDVVHSAAAKVDLNLTADSQSAFSVFDSSGNEYPVVSLKPKQSQLNPGSTETLVIRADGSPQWWNIKSMQLRIAPRLFNSSKAIELSQRISDIEKRNVEAFD